MMRAEMRPAIAIALVLAACGGTDAPGDDPDARVDDRDAPAPVDAALDAPAPDATPRACAPARDAGHQTFSCPEGVTADVEASAACVDGGCGVILDVHGYTMSADQQDAHTRMRALAPPRGYVVVQPTAPGVVPSWGIGEHDDVVWELLLATIDTFAIDRDRVHVTGFSQGGMMSFRLVCAHADQLASIAPVAGAGCFDEPAVEVPILYVHGHLDTIVPWQTSAVPQRDAITSWWTFGAGAEIASGADFTATRWVTDAGTPFELWEHDDTTGDVVLAGHCLHGPDDDQTFRCDDSEFDLATVVLDFFDAHPRAD